LDRFFGITAAGSSVRTEILAGATTFMTMAYILAVNPDILAAAGMDRGAVFTATALSAAVGTAVMALVARLPFALAPGMGLNAFFAYTVVVGMGYSWQLALTAVFVEGLVFLLLTFLNVREAIIGCIPLNLKRAISGGIGLFIAFIGLEKAGIVSQGQGTPLTLGDLSQPTAWLALGGLLISAVLVYRRVPGALLIGMIATTLAGAAVGLVSRPEGWGAPPSLTPVFLQFEWESLWSRDLLMVLLTFLFVDLFDTAGTLIGVSAKAGMLDEKGQPPRVRQALLADAVGTTCGACLGTSTVTTYVESAAGLAAGGRTGLTALVTAVLFLGSLVLWPLFLVIPAAATAGVLVLVGVFMLSPVLETDLDDFSEAVPVFLTLLMMPLTYSIAEGIVFGVVSWVLLKVLGGRWREVPWVTAVLTGLFLARFFF